MIRSFLILPLLALLISASASQPSDNVKWGDEAKGCRVGLSTSSPFYNFEDSVSLHVRVHNESDDSRKVSGAGVAPFGIEVFLPNGNSAPLTEDGEHLLRKSGLAAAMENWKVLEPGATREAIIPALNRYYDMTLPGKYEILIQWYVQSDIDPNAYSTAISTIYIEMADRYIKID